MLSVVVLLRSNTYPKFRLPFPQAYAYCGSLLRSNTYPKWTVPSMPIFMFAINTLYQFLLFTLSCILCIPSIFCFNCNFAERRKQINFSTLCWKIKSILSLNPSNPSFSQSSTQGEWMMDWWTNWTHLDVKIATRKTIKFNNLYDSFSDVTPI